MADVPPPFALHFAEGVEHFNAGRFWEAHESWETLWLVSDSEMRQFLQGLIQLAAAYLHLRRANFSGSIRLFDAALGRLEAIPDGYCGVAISDLTHHARDSRDLGARAKGSLSDPSDLSASAPTIVLTADWRSRVPPD